ncbi:MAG: glutamine synthetase III [Planctomycetaceae bacterium]|nr:glutamine synthetase III [Planctomycetaceae bacterium]
MGASVRQQAIEAISTSDPIHSEAINFRRESIGDVFARHVFHEGVQQERLPAEVFRSLRETAKSRRSLDPAIADAVASAMHAWAVEHGATHFSHWFQPMTGSTAEKHDGFLTPIDEHRVISRFRGSELVRGESDASSFPTGGLRATFEARGYTAWDPSSPAFLLENPNGMTLVIPTLFFSWTGDSLDKKTPLLRSNEVIDKQAVRMLRLLGNTTTTRVECAVGAEQEYFLVDHRLAVLRPDLLVTGRTLFGAKPPKGQELDDNYFCAIPERVLALMTETEYRLMQLGVPVKTRHNETAPGQFELAPVYEMANLAIDHQMLVMQTLKSVAAKHGFMCLLHEKPFAGVNGSGKHNNWSLVTDDGENLLEPGATPEANLQFLVFCAAVVRAVHRHGGLLRTAVAGAGNDHRLGANEAPPAIMSVFLGTALEDIFRHIEQGSNRGRRNVAPIQLGLSMIPNIPRHSGDRNRTSPFAFTGNKFEFRAVGASQNPADANTFLNTMVAESLDEMATRLEQEFASGKEQKAAVQQLLADVIRECQPVLYDGDCYSKEWHEEASRRGLPHIRTTVDCLAVYGSQEAAGLFAKYGVLSQTELHSRREIFAEHYVSTIKIEVATALEMAKTMILPAVLKYKSNIAPIMTTPLQKEELAELDTLIDNLIVKIRALQLAFGTPPANGPMTHAKFCCAVLLPALQELRHAVDRLEEVVDDNVWPLPTYGELLFIR